MTAHACPACLSRRRVLGGLAGLTASLVLLSACHKDDPLAARQPPVPIGPDDLCAVCGMTIAQAPGPKAEAYLEDHPGVLKFGGTMDFFSFILQPENHARVQSVYVQDMAGLPWDHPIGHWIDARKAWYVSDLVMPGEMGPTLAAFRQQKDAEAFRRQFGGDLLRFDQITMKEITALGAHQLCRPVQSGKPGQ